MDPKQTGTSFIPRQSLGSVPPPVRRRPRRAGVISTIGFIIFLGSILLTIGVFGYQMFLRANIERKSEELITMREQFRSDRILELKRLDARLTAAEDLLNEHVILSSVFEFLEQHTVTNVRFSNFEFGREESGRMLLTMNGEAEGFSSVALQSDEFLRQSQYIQNPVFSDLNLSEEGTVVFSFTASIDPSLVAPIAVATGESVIVIPETVPESDEEEEGTTTATTSNTTQL